MKTYRIRLKSNKTDKVIAEIVNGIEKFEYAVELVQSSYKNPRCIQSWNLDDDGNYLDIETVY